MIGDRASERRAARRRATRAAALSLLFHLVLIIGIAWLLVAGPEAPPPPPEPAEVEITFVEPPPPPEPPPTRFVDSTAPESEPPAQAAFESDRNTAAASPDAATGDAPVPTQDGMELPGVELEQRELALAEVAPAPPAPESPPALPAPPQPPEAAPPSAEKPPTEEIKPETTAIAKAEPLPDKPEEPKTPPPPAAVPSRPAFQRQTRPTRLSGSVSNRGRASVASLATPLGRYRKVISDAIGSSWYHHIGPRMDMFSYGTVSVVFVVDRDGKVKRPRVTSNTSNESFEIVTLESILSADIPPIPPDIVATLEGGQIEIDYTFSIITN